MKKEEVRKDVVEMEEILLQLGDYEYQEAKHLLLAKSKADFHPGTIIFIEKLFECTDSRRALQLEMH